MEQESQLGRSLSGLRGVRSVLVLGSSAGLLKALQSAGLEAEGSAWHEVALVSALRTYDIVLCLGAPNLTPKQCAVITIALAPRSGRILFSSGPDAVCAVWLRAFLEAGYGPDLALDVQWAGTGAVLLRAGSTDLDQAAILAELLHLRSRLMDGNSPDPSIDIDLAARYAEVERAIQDTRALTERLSHTVHAMAQSRIWRTLAAVGGWVLSVQRIGGRLLGRTAPLPRDPEPAPLPRDSEPAPLPRDPEPAPPPETDAHKECDVRVHCDEPDSKVLQALLQTGIRGTLRVEGWAVSDYNISRVELKLGDLPSVQARIGLYRPDLKSRFPTLANAGRGGFIGHVDTAPLPNGRHTLTIRAFDIQGGTAHLELPLTVDHIHGYANDYDRWIEDFEKKALEQIEHKQQTLLRRPLISIIVPVYRTRATILEKTVRSVLNQSYPEWELCMADDCSRSPEVDAILERYSASDTRVKVVRLPENRGISAASNAALAMATGEFIGLLDHDDELAQDALLHVADALNRQPDTDLVYSDEDHIDENGHRSDPFFKPDWSPDLILGENYVCHFLLLRTSLCRELGGFRSQTDLSQDHDIVLRASLRTRRILHIPKILYHWRTNVSMDERASDAHRQRALETSRRAVEDHLTAMGTPAIVVPGAVSQRWRVRYPIPAEQSVRILVSCGGNLNLLKLCLADLAEKTDFRPFQVSVIDNSRGAEVADFVTSWSAGGRRAGYVDYRNRPFNYSAMNNLAARNAQEPLLLFLNDDVSMIHADWLTAMVELASRPEVGAVGAKLLFPDNTIQHAGVVVGIFGTAGHVFKKTFAEDRVYFDFPDLIRNVSAVTGACMMVPTEKFWACGGFDEEGLPVSYNDVDLCLKLGQTGYRILYTPHARLYHHEAVSKSAVDRNPLPAEIMLFKARWKHVIECDPFYNPNLTLDAEDYSYRKRPV